MKYFRDCAVIVIGGTIVIYSAFMWLTNPDYGVYKDDWRWDTVQAALLELGSDSAIQIVEEMDSE